MSFLSLVFFLDDGTTDSKKTKQFTLLITALFIVFVPFYVYLGREGHKLYNLGFRYFKSFWNWVELCQLSFSVIAVVMCIVQLDRVTSATRKLQENVYAIVSFHEAIAWLEVKNAVFGIVTQVYRYCKTFTAFSIFPKHWRHQRDFFHRCCCVTDFLPSFLTLWYSDLWKGI